MDEQPDISQRELAEKVGIPYYPIRLVNEKVMLNTYIYRKSQSTNQCKLFRAIRHLSLLGYGCHHCRGIGCNLKNLELITDKAAIPAFFVDPT